MKNTGKIDTLLRRETRTDGENKFSYELLMKESSSVASFRLPLYSVRIYMVDGKGKERVASATDIFVNEERALIFFEKIVRNLATPIDLAYVVEDEAVI